MVRIKICGLTRQEDAEAALEHGAHALGFVYEPTSPRYVGGNRETAELPFKFSPYAITVGVYGEVSEFADPCLLTQYVGRSKTKGFLKSLTELPLSDLRPTVCAFRLMPDETVDVLEARLRKTFENTPNMHAALIDAYDPEQFGGTGKRVDWDLVAELVNRVEIPVVLAGGLTPDNVAEAIVKVRPYAVDVSSGVELSPGVKDVYKVRDFISAASSAL